MIRPKLIVFVLCVWLVPDVQAQRDSVHVLRTVEIIQSRLGDHIVAAYELPIDSAMLSTAANGTLTDLLRKQGLGHIRSYGPGGLASPSFRGTGGSHTTILWNGISLISPLSGQQDLSLLPAGLFDNIGIQTGGSSSVSGSGSIGANIHLNNGMNFGEGLRMKASAFAGSFGSQFYDAAVDASNKTLGSSTRIFYAAADNDFRFLNRNVFPPEEQRRQHSAQQQHGLLQQLHTRTSRLGVFSLKFWYQKSRYEIPNATTITRPSEATERNEFYRSLIGWNYAHKKLELNYQAAFIRQDLSYQDPVLNLSSVNLYNSFVHNVEANVRYANKSLVTSGVNYTWEQGIVDDFGVDQPVRNRIAVFAAYKNTSLAGLTFSVSGREEIVNGRTTPFAPTVSARYQASKAINLFTNLSRNYRLPTFNDLYWKGAGTSGNPDLKAETSLNAELGAQLTTSAVSMKAVAFTNHVDNWIQWTPQEGQAWVPQNIKEVWCRGLESQATYDARLGAVASRLTIQYSFTRSTNETIYGNGNPNERGKQLLLTPLHEGSAAGGIAWHNYSLRLVCAYTGKQYNDSDNTPYNIVEDYLITNLWINKSLLTKELRLSFSGEVNNLFNVSYQARPGYPMPGINFKLGIQITFNKTHYDS